MSGKPSKDRVVRAVSAGGVVYRREEDNIDVVLCGRREPQRWSLPKGTPDKGETIEETAIREAQEETGLKVTVEEPLGSINYWFAIPQDHTRFNKTVHFYLMLARGGRTEDHDPEFDEVHWFSAEEARRLLTFANEARILDMALARIRGRVSSG